MPMTLFGVLTTTKERIRIHVNDVHRAIGTACELVDLDTGKRYRGRRKSCGLPRCMCDLWLKPLDEESPPSSDRGGTPPGTA